MDAPQVTEVEVSFIKWLGGLFIAALGSLLMLIYNKHEKDLDKLEASVAKKADKDDTDKRLERGSEKFDELLNEMRGMRQDVQSLNTHLLTELASRPTREEVRSMLQQQGRG